MGAFRVQLVYQFVSESIVMALIAVVIGGILAEVGLPLVNSFAEKNIPPQIFLNPVVIPILLISAMVLGIFAGAYPAFYISHFRQHRFCQTKIRERLRAGHCYGRASSCSSLCCHSSLSRHRWWSATSSNFSAQKIWASTKTIWLSLICAGICIRISKRLEIRFLIIQTLLT